MRSQGHSRDGIEQAYPRRVNAEHQRVASLEFCAAVSGCDVAFRPYVWGDDYHDVLKQRLDALLAWMRAESPELFDARGYVDTGPVQERV